VDLNKRTRRRQCIEGEFDFALSMVLNLFSITVLYSKCAMFFDSSRKTLQTHACFVYPNLSFSNRDQCHPFHQVTQKYRTSINKKHYVSRDINKDVTKFFCAKKTNFHKSSQANLFSDPMPFAYKYSEAAATISVSS
jgi:hypothetical protein